MNNNDFVKVNYAYFVKLERYFEATQAFFNRANQIEVMGNEIKSERIKGILEPS